MNYTDAIREYALNIGFTKIGFTDARDLDGYIKELRSRGKYYKLWQKKLGDGARISKHMKNGKTLIVLAYDYGQKSYPDNLTKMIGRAYLSRSYLPLPDSSNGAMLHLFENFLTKNGIQFVRDENKIPMRWAAAKAGVANFGKNNFAYVDGVGSFVILYGYIIDKILKYDTPTFQNKCPKGCRKCIDGCPTKALYQPFHLNPSRCIGYNNWIRRSDRLAPDEMTIPEDIRKNMGCHIHGCDICQEVCPRNAIKNKNKNPKDRYIEQIKEDITLPNLLHMPDGFYESRVYPIMHNYLKEKEYFQRNAAIAMGNSSDKKYLSELEKEKNNPNEMIRFYVNWSIQQLKNI